MRKRLLRMSGGVFSHEKGKAQDRAKESFEPVNPALQDSFFCGMMKKDDFAEEITVAGGIH